MSKCQEIVNHFGGTVEAFKALMQMHRIGFSRNYDYVDGELVICDIHSHVGYFPSELELALEECLSQQVLSHRNPHNVVYTSASEPPEVFHKQLRVNGFNSSMKTDKLILKYEYKGKVDYATGYMLRYMYDRPDEFRLDGHGGDWHNTVIGWAYC